MADEFLVSRDKDGNRLGVFSGEVFIPWDEWVHSMDLFGRPRLGPSPKRIRELRAMPYSDYLRTPEWQATRVKVLVRCDYRCQICNGQDRLEVHHRTYERLAQELEGDLILLCRDCHGLFHREGRLAS